MPIYVGGDKYSPNCDKVYWGADKLWPNKVEFVSVVAPERAPTPPSTANWAFSWSHNVTTAGYLIVYINVYGTSSALGSDYAVTCNGVPMTQVVFRFVSGSVCCAVFVAKVGKGTKSLVQTKGKSYDGCSVLYSASDYRLIDNSSISGGTGTKAVTVSANDDEVISQCFFAANTTIEDYSQTLRYRGVRGGAYSLYIIGAGDAPGGGGVVFSYSHVGVPPAVSVAIALSP